MAEPIKYMDVQEFKDFGYLHELNRKFLHPLGLALEVRTDELGTHLGGIWDSRDDPEGMRYDEKTLDPQKVMNVEEEYHRRRPIRENLLGYMVQPMTRGPEPHRGDYENFFEYHEAWMEYHHPNRAREGLTSEILD